MTAELLIRAKGMRYPYGCPTPFEKLSGETRNRQA